LYAFDWLLAANHRVHGRYLLGFGTVSKYLGYNALSDFFPTYPMLPNPTCSQSSCVAAQAAYQVHFLFSP
jgi:hypothetical protein